MFSYKLATRVAVSLILLSPVAAFAVLLPSLNDVSKAERNDWVLIKKAIQHTEKAKSKDLSQEVKLKSVEESFKSPNEFVKRFNYGAAYLSQNQYGYSYLKGKNAIAVIVENLPTKTGMSRYDVRQYADGVAKGVCKELIKKTRFPTKLKGYLITDGYGTAELLGKYSIDINYCKAKDKRDQKNRIPPELAAVCNSAYAKATLQGDLSSFPDFCWTEEVLPSLCKSARASAILRGTRLPDRCVRYFYRQ